MKTYILNKDLLYIYPLQKGIVKIVNINDEVIIYDDILDILDKNCKINGSSLKGRMDASSYILNGVYKCPIIISEFDKLIIFPNKSPKSGDCIWINYKYITHVEHLGNGSKIFFNNSKFLYLKSSHKQIQNQIYKSLYIASNLNGKL